MEPPTETEIALGSAARPSPRHELRREVRQLFVDGAPVRVGGRAFDLLVALVDRAGRLLDLTSMLTRN